MPSAVSPSSKDSGPPTKSLNGTQEQDTSSTVELKREVGLIGGISFIVGSIVGSGIFVSPKGVLAGAGSVGVSLLVWLVGGIVVLIGSVSYVELGTLITKSGGEYAYLREAFHPIFAFLFSFMQTILLRPATNAIIAQTCGEYLGVLFFDDGCGSPPIAISKCIAIAVLLGIAAINMYSTDMATNVQIVFTAAKLVALVVIVIGGFIKLAQGYTEHLDNAFEWVDGPASVGSIALGFYSSMWAYDGWNTLNLCVEELIEPEKNLPRAIIIGIPLVIILYILTNISYFTVLSPMDVLGSDAVAVTWAERVMPQFAWMIPLFVALSTFGALNGMLFSSGRLVFVTAREGHMLSILSNIQVRRQTPDPAIIVTIILSCLLLIPGSIGALIDLFGFASWIFYGMVFASLIYLRYKVPDAPRPYKVPIILPIIALIVSVYLVLAPIIDDPKVEYFYALAFILAGLIFYFPFVHFKKELPGMDSFNMFWQLLLQCVPPPEFNQDLHDHDPDLDKRDIATTQAAKTSGTQKEPSAIQDTGAPHIEHDYRF